MSGFGERSGRAVVQRRAVEVDRAAGPKLIGATENSRSRAGICCWNVPSGCGASRAPAGRREVAFLVDGDLESAADQARRQRADVDDARAAVMITSPRFVAV